MCGCWHHQTSFHTDVDPLILVVNRDDGQMLPASCVDGKSIWAARATYNMIISVILCPFQADFSTHISARYIFKIKQYCSFMVGLYEYNIWIWGYNSLLIQANVILAVLATDHGILDT